MPAATSMPTDHPVALGDGGARVACGVIGGAFVSVRVPMR